MSATINAQADAAMARVHQHINRCAAQQARRMTEGWARIGRATPAAAPLQPPLPQSTGSQGTGQGLNQHHHQEKTP